MSPSAAQREEGQRRRAQILTALHDLTQQMGFQPSIREIGTYLGISHTAVYYQLQNLEKEGRVVRTTKKARSLQVVKP